MAVNGFSINKSLGFQTQAAAPTTPVEGDIYRSADGLQAYHGGKWLPLVNESDNLAVLWGDCEAALLAETRTSSVDTTARTLGYWAYDNGQSAPAATATELFGSQSYEASMTEIGEFLETPLFAIPLGYVGKALNVSFLLNTGAAVATTDYKVQVIRYDSNRVYQETITCQGANFLGIGTWTGFFITGSTSTDLYSIMVYSNVAPTIVFKVDQFYVGQNSLAVGFGGTDSQEMTQVLTPGTSGSITNNASYKTTYFVHGNILFMNVVAIVSSVSSPVGTVLIQLPSGYTVKKGATSFGRVGTGLYYDDSASAGSKYIEIAASYSASTPAGYVEIGSNDESLAIPTPAAGDSVQIELAIPINETTSGITMLSSDRVKSVVAANRSSALAIVKDAARDIIFNRERTDIKSEYDTSTGIFTAKSAGYYEVEYNLTTTISASKPTVLEAWILASTGTIQYGSYYNTDITASTTLPIAGNAKIYLPVGGTLKVQIYATGNDVSILNAISDIDYSYIYISQDTDRDALAGLPISTANVIGRTDSIGVPVGFVGQKISFTERAVTCPAAAAWGVNTSALCTLTKGVWLVFYHISFAANNTANEVIGVISSSDSAGTGGIGYNCVAVNNQNTNASAAAASFQAPVNHLVISSDTYNLYAQAISEDQTNLVVTFNGFATRIA